MPEISLDSVKTRFELEIKKDVGSKLEQNFFIYVSLEHKFSAEQLPQKIDQKLGKK